MNAHKYARVLFELCNGSNCLDEVADNFKLFVKSMNEESSWLLIVSSPSLNKEDKRNLLKGLSDFNPIFLNFLYLLLDEGVLSNFNNIYKQFYYQLLRSKNIAEITISTRGKLSKERLLEIKKILSIQLPNMDLKITEKIDGNLLGGEKIFYEDEIIDHSYQGLLREMKEKV